MVVVFSRLPPGCREAPGPAQHLLTKPGKEHNKKLAFQKGLCRSSGPSPAASGPQAQGRGQRPPQGSGKQPRRRLLPAHARRTSCPLQPLPSSPCRSIRPRHRFPIPAEPSFLPRPQGLLSPPTPAFLPFRLSGSSASCQALDAGSSTALRYTSSCRVPASSWL